MISYLLFAFSLLLVPFFFIRFLDEVSQKSDSIKNGVLSVVFLCVASFSLSGGSVMGTLGMSLCTCSIALAICGTYFVKFKFIREKRTMCICMFVALVILVLLNSMAISNTYPEMFSSVLLVIIGFVIAVVVFVCIMLASAFYSKSQIFKGFCTLAVFFVFFVIALLGIVSFVSDGLVDVMVAYKIAINSEFLNVWWISPVGFALMLSFLLISKDLVYFAKMLIGYIITTAIIVMVVGEIFKIVGSTTLVVVVDTLGDILKSGGYDESIITGISKLAGVFEVFGYVMFAGVLAAGLFSFVQFRSGKRKNNGSDGEKVISVEQMRKSDEYTIKNFVSGKDLMKRAAQGVYDSVDWTDKKVAIVCGSGNNGGDGYALSGILAENGNIPTVFRLSEKFSEDGKFYYSQAEQSGVVFEMFGMETMLSEFDIVVDCIFGTGFKGIPKNIYAEAINKINESGAYVVSVDINSGMDGDTGEAQIAVKSDITVSVGYYKDGMFKGKAPELIGELKNIDIGIVLV